ncbi:MAG: hypothetical protein V4490_00280, partial [Pseudomonadota bacterium]
MQNLPTNSVISELNALAAKIPLDIADYAPGSFTLLDCFATYATATKNFETTLHQLPQQLLEKSQRKQLSSALRCLIQPLTLVEAQIFVMYGVTLPLCQMMIAELNTDTLLKVTAARRD